MLIASQINAMDALKESYEQTKEEIVKKAQKQQDVQSFSELEKDFGHYSVLCDFIHAKIAVGHEVPAKRIKQLRCELEDVSRKIKGYLAAEGDACDQPLPKDINEGLESGKQLLVVLENPELLAQLKGLVQSN